MYILKCVNIYKKTNCNKNVSFIKSIIAKLEIEYKLSDMNKKYLYYKHRARFWFLGITNKSEFSKNRGSTTD